MSGYVINPIAIPVAMLEVSGIVNKMAKAGKASSNVFQSIRANPPIMKQPTIMRTGAVIAGNDEMAETTGEKKIANKNKPATTSDVKPVRPPAATPEEDSI